MEMKPYIVYVQLNDDGYITSINSSAFLTDVVGWFEIDSGFGDKYHHAQGNYFEQSIYTNNGACRYKMVNGKPVECTIEEISQQENVEVISKPSQLDIIEAQVTYTAMMTDTLLEV